MVWWPTGWSWCTGGDLGDPGPCPVDDTPHTACTPESVAAQRRGVVTVPLRRPFVLDMVPPPPVESHTSVEINPKTYRGRAGFLRDGRPRKKAR